MRDQQMSIHEFGDQLIRTGDLDPVYVGLARAELDDQQMCRLLLAYWCFYHLGAACWMSEATGIYFWGRMRTAAHNVPGHGPPSEGVRVMERWPRGTERRHFRGQKCVDAVNFLSDSLSPEAPVESLMGYTTASNVMSHVQQWPMFGPWIAFKAADMLERLLPVRLAFPPDLGLMYSEPAAGLELLTKERGDTKENWWGRLQVYFARTPAPPTGDRACNVQEVETVLCKWKSMRGGHYWVGKDIREVRHGLEGWGRTADRVLAAMPVEVA